MTAHLAPDLSLGERHALLLGEAGRLKWSIARWPRWLLRLGWSRGRSAAMPLGVPGLPGRTVYLAEAAIESRGLLAATERTVALLAHELCHARRQEAEGRAKWMAFYLGGPVLAGVALVALLVGGVLAIAVAPWGLVPGAVLAWLALGTWGPSADWRRDEEVEAEAHETAARAAARGCPLSRDLLTVDRLHSYRWPYLVGGLRAAVEDEVLGRAGELLAGMGCQG